MLDDKADLDLVHQINAQKASAAEVEQIRKLIDRLAFDIESKPSYKDLDSQASH